MGERWQKKEKETKRKNKIAGKSTREGERK